MRLLSRLASAAILSGAILQGAAIASAPAFAAGPVKVVAAENFYGDLARQIGSDHVAVTSILANPDDDPHLFETSPSTAKAIAGADIVISNGADYDPWMEKLLSASPKPGRTSIVAADLIGAKPGDNPHLWYDPKTFPAVAKALTAALAKADPADAKAFEAHLAAFDKSLEPIVAEEEAIRRKHAGLEVTATEPVFGYMAKALGFKMLNYDFQVAVMNNAEPSPSQVAAFEDSITGGKAKVLFYNRQVTDKTTSRLLEMAKKAHVPVVGVTETEPKDVEIQGWFSGQLKQIASILDAKPM